MWHHQETWGGSISPFNLTDPLAIGVTDNNPQCVTPGYTQLITNYHGRVGSAYTPSHNPNTRTNFAASYVTGSHAFKAGMDFSWAERGAWTGSIVPYSYVVSTSRRREEWAFRCPQTLNLRTDGCNDPLARMVNGSLTTPVTAYNASAELSDVCDRQDRWRGRSVRAGPVDDEPDHAQSGRPSGYVHGQHSRLSPVAVDHHAASQLRRAGLHVGASEGHHAEDGGRLGRARATARPRSR